ncbi:MAG: hypothetical protein HN368_02440 [Spirochaetales bacterium]|jgi:hypothetical protein|nr:hypothetical protein [Spirochaetales bacterium]
MSDPYSDIKEHFSAVSDVTVNSGKGSQGLKYGKKMFVMFHKGDLLVQFAPERVAELVTSGDAELFDPGTGKPMKDRVRIPVAKKGSWIALCEESKLYAESRA